MAKEAIEAVKKAEAEADAILQEANDTSRDLRREGETLSEEKYQDIMDQAEREAEAIRKKAISDGEDIAKPIIDKGLKDAEKINALKDEELDEAVNIIIEKVVNTDGNS